MSRITDSLVAAAYRAGRRLGPRLSDRARSRIAAIGGRLGPRLAPDTAAAVRSNLQALTGRPPSPALVRATFASWLRNFCETFALGGWSPAQILRRVSVTGDEPLRAAVARTGAVVALPHSGNWDLAGAWACLTGMPVITVAEELTGAVAAEYAAFLRLRTRLGMVVVSHRDPQALRILVDGARPGRVICLVADRDLLGTGLAVRWGRRPGAPTVRVPIGPALVARRAAVPLFAMVARYTETGIAMTIGPPITVEPGRAGLVDATQACVDFFADRLARTPEDWHLMRPFFTAATPDPVAAP